MKACESNYISKSDFLEICIETTRKVLYGALAKRCNSQAKGHLKTPSADSDAEFFDLQICIFKILLLFLSGQPFRFLVKIITLS